MNELKTADEGNAKISVIMLTYNREKLIGRMIDCILKQTFREFEFIVVDNGSTDRSGMIAEEYATTDSRIRVVHKEKGNIGSGRNAGLDVAHGEWIAFVDDDDTCEPDFLEFLYNLTHEGVDIAICGACHNVVDERHIWIAEDALEEMFARKKFNVQFPTKLIRRSLFDKIRFDETAKYDDIELMPQIIAKADRVIYHGVGKYTFERHGNNHSAWTTDHRLLDANTLEEYLSAYQKRTEWLCEMFPDRSLTWKYFKWSFMISMLQKIYRYDLADCKKYTETITSELIEHRSEFLNCKQIQVFERKWLDKYVTSGADFNNNFLFCLTTLCNKMCKYCMVFSPYLTAKGLHYHPSFEELCAEIDGLFQIIDSSSGIQFGGGEPCIRKDLPKLIDYVAKYKDKISDYTRLGTGFGIITNASIPFSDELIEASKRFGPKLVWLLDDYYFSQGKEIAAVLEKNNINYVLRDQRTDGKLHCDGWLNFFNDYTGPIDEEAAIENYSRCGQAQSIFQFIIAQGNIYPCSRPMSVDMYWPDKHLVDDYRVEILTGNLSRKEKVDKLKSLMCANHYMTCGFCGGLHAERKVRHYPAEQLTEEEYDELKKGCLSMMDFSNENED